MIYRYDPKTRTTVKVQHMSGREQGTFYSIDSDLSDEIQGRRPSAGKRDWKEFWRWRISLWRRHSNFKYEEYLVRRRKELKLQDVDDL